MKTALVTGSSKGIGLAITKNLLDRGFKVYGLSRTTPNLEHPNFVWIECDLYNDQSIHNAIKNINAEEINLVVMNAGIAFGELASDLTVESYKRTYDLNVLAPMLIVKDLHPKIQSACIISISSVSARIVDAEFSLYCSSKAAINMYFQSLAKEIESARVFNILPTYVDTPLLRGLHENDGFNFDPILQPQDVANLVQDLESGLIDVESGSNIMIVNSSLLEDFKSDEILYGYIADTKEIKKFI